ncbi:MAG: hypothetical protein JXQ27_09230 [Acidobacteria bacterium]|nr:hypothetical protein [Acidobacteriota bacterium]
MRASPDEQPPPASPDLPADQPDFSPEGVDLTLIRWMLTLTPAQRLEVLQSTIASLQRMKHDRHPD